MGSSIEILPKPDESGIFAAHFNELKKSPIDFWLKQEPVVEPPTDVTVCARPMEQCLTSERENLHRFGIKSPRMTDDRSSIRSEEIKDEPANSKKRRLACANEAPSSEKIEYNFGNLFKGIQKSDNAEWLLTTKESSSETTSDYYNTLKSIFSKQMTSDETVDDCTRGGKQKRVWYPTVVNANKESNWSDSDMSQWLAKDPNAKADVPINQMAQNVAVWESVIGWQKILEKIHTSGENEWLVPSSRNL